MKILFTGVHSAGKDVLIKNVLQDYPDFVTNSGLIRSFTVLPFFKAYKETDDTSQLMIVNSMFTFLFQNFNKNVIFNRFLIDNLAYAHYCYHESKTISKRIFDYSLYLFENNIKYMDLIFYIPIEFKMVEDGFRPIDEEYRKYIDKYIKQYLDDYKIKYVTLIGSIENRYNIVKENLKGIKECRR